MGEFNHLSFPQIFQLERTIPDVYPIYDLHIYTTAKHLVHNAICLRFQELTFSRLPFISFKYDNVSRLKNQPCTSPIKAPVVVSVNFYSKTGMIDNIPHEGFV